MKNGTVYLCSKNAPLILEVHEKPLFEPAVLAPVVQSLRIKTTPEIAANVSCLNIPELAWSTTQETALQVSGAWHTVQHLVN